MDLDSDLLHDSAERTSIENPFFSPGHIALVFLLWDCDSHMSIEEVHSGFYTLLL